MVSAPFFYFLFFLSAPHDQPSQSMNTFADLSSEAILPIIRKAPSQLSAIK
jgi:hypothetical protein